MLKENPVYLYGHHLKDLCVHCVSANDIFNATFILKSKSECGFFLHVAGLILVWGACVYANNLRFFCTNSTMWSLQRNDQLLSIFQILYSALSRGKYEWSRSWTTSATTIMYIIVCMCAYDQFPWWISTSVHSSLFSTESGRIIFLCGHFWQK